MESGDGIRGRVAWTGERRASAIEASGRAPGPGRPGPFVVSWLLAFAKAAVRWPWPHLCAPGQIKRRHLPRVHFTYVPRAATATPTGPVLSSPLTSRRGKAHYP